MKSVLKITILIVFSIFLFFCISRIPIKHQEISNQVLAAETEEEIPGSPARLRIPNINVDAPIEYVGVTPGGIMDVPKDTINVGWFNLGPRPGEKGNAVIAGHVDGKMGEDSVFTNLYKLKEGDKIYVDDDMGKSIIFVVKESHTYDPGYAEDVFSSENGTHLNLITCNGFWDKEKKGFSKRLVVFTDIVN